jgi:hypothetical protein
VPPSDRWRKSYKNAAPRHSHYQLLLHLQRDHSKRMCPAIANQWATRLLTQRAPNQHELCQPVKISEALYSPLPQGTGNPAQSSASYTLAARRIQPVAIQALQHLVVHKWPFSGPALPHRMQRSPCASRPACISNKRGQLCSVTWSCFDTPLVLRGIVSACVHSHTAIWIMKFLFMDSLQGNDYSQEQGLAVCQRIMTVIWPYSQETEHHIQK